MVKSRNVLGIILVLSLFLSTQVHSGVVVKVNFAWDASTGDVGGYELHRGLTTGAYPDENKVVIQGTGTTGSMMMDTDYPWYVAALAYSASDPLLKSAFSNEILCLPVLVSTGTGGTISPSGNFFVQENHSVNFTITPITGYRVKDVTVNGVSKGAVTNLTQVATVRTLVNATFELIPPKPPIDVHKK